MSQKTFKYPNADITVIWKPDTCIHSTKCWRELIAVFNPKNKPWIKMEGANTERIIAQVKRCPSGALSFILNEEQKKENPVVVESPPGPEQNIIECLPNGPLLVKGNVLVKKSDGTEELQNGTVALCRCGGSGNKPYCDGTHNKNGFQG